jgi:hypothetical protein
VCGSAHSVVRTVRAAACDKALGGEWHCARQCAAVWQCGSSAAVCAQRMQCARQGVTVRLVVYSSAVVRVWQCGSVRQFVAVHTAVCVSACVRQFASEVYVAVCGSVRDSALIVLTHKVAHDVFIGMPLYKRRWD